MDRHRRSVSEHFWFESGNLIREVSSGLLSARTFISVEEPTGDPVELWDRKVLLGAVPMLIGEKAGVITIADVFCGAGGLSYGAVCAGAALGLDVRVSFGADQDREALTVFQNNLRPSAISPKNISSLVDYAIDGSSESAKFAYRPAIIDESLVAWENEVNVLVGGPPCQGHSNLNNRTRREDPRNLLYLSVPALAVALNVQAVIIENVPDVRQDKQSVFSTAVSLLRSEGYVVSTLLMNATTLGVPQTRKRLFLLATKGAQLDIKDAYRACQRPGRSVMYSIADLESSDSKDVFRCSANIDAVSQARIDHLFDHDLYDLPNELRPDCHRDGNSYPSVYGRIRADEPSGTITQGFNTMGRGRFIHPTQRRPITPHEAARIQGFGDSYVWNQPNGDSWSRSTYAKLIGNAVPPAMGYVAMLSILASLYPESDVPACVELTTSHS
jgi:DNA (cytosine-5)-methyltransferase 1